MFYKFEVDCNRFFSMLKDYFKLSYIQLTFLSFHRYFIFRRSVVLSAGYLHVRDVFAGGRLHIHLLKA